MVACMPELWVETLQIIGTRSKELDVVHCARQDADSSESNLTAERTYLCNGMVTDLA